MRASHVLSVILKYYFPFDTGYWPFKILTAKSYAYVLRSPIIISGTCSQVIVDSIAA